MAGHPITLLSPKAASKALPVRTHKQSAAFVCALCIFTFGTFAPSLPAELIASTVIDTGPDGKPQPFCDLSRATNVRLILPPMPHGDIEREPPAVVRAAAEEVLYGGPDIQVLVRELIVEAKRNQGN